MKPISVLAMVVAVVLLLFWLVTMRSHYIRLQHKSREYYVELASACDSILENHPLGTNKVIWISVTDSSLPKAVRDLHPLKLQVNPQRVWMLLDSDSHNGIGLEWQPEWENANVWKLDIIAESFETIIYSSNRIKLPNGSANPN